MIVSGYLSIFCCRTRPTQDIHVIFIPFSEKHLKKLIDNLKSKEYDVHYDEEGWRKYKDLFYIYTNKEIGGYNLYFEVKQPKDEYHHLALTNKVKIKKKDIWFYFSPLELQIPYKLWLGSDKDILDAYYLLELFKDVLDEKIMYHYAERLGVRNELEKGKSSGD